MSKRDWIWIRRESWDILLYGLKREPGTVSPAGCLCYKDFKRLTGISLEEGEVAKMRFAVELIEEEKGK